MKTLNFVKLCMASLFALSFLLTSSASASTGEGCNVSITLNNSNDDSNQVLGGGSCCCSCDTPCKKCSTCCDCIDFIFDSVFTFTEALVPDLITITPFVINPNCALSIGDTIPLDVSGDNGTAAIRECIKVPFCCGETYTVGYLFIGPTFVAPISGSITQNNNDRMCVCGKSIPLPQQSEILFATLQSSFFGGRGYSTISTCCCECPCECKCLCPREDCAVPPRRGSGAFAL